MANVEAKWYRIFERDLLIKILKRVTRTDFVLGESIMISKLLKLNETKWYRIWCILYTWQNNKGVIFRKDPPLLLLRLVERLANMHAFWTSYANNLEYCFLVSKCNGKIVYSVGEKFPSTSGSDGEGEPVHKPQMWERVCWYLLPDDAW